MKKLLSLALALALILGLMPSGKMYAAGYFKIEGESVITSNSRYVEIELRAIPNSGNVSDFDGFLTWNIEGRIDGISLYEGGGKYNNIVNIIVDTYKIKRNSISLRCTTPNLGSKEKYIELKRVSPEMTEYDLVKKEYSNGSNLKRISSGKYEGHMDVSEFDSELQAEYQLNSLDNSIPRINSGTEITNLAFKNNLKPDGIEAVIENNYIVIKANRLNASRNQNEFVLTFNSGTKQNELRYSVNFLGTVGIDVRKKVFSVESSDILVPKTGGQVTLIPKVFIDGKLQTNPFDLVTISSPKESANFVINKQTGVVDVKADADTAYYPVKFTLKPHLNVPAPDDEIYITITKSGLINAPGVSPKPLNPLFTFQNPKKGYVEMKKGMTYGINNPNNSLVFTPNTNSLITANTANITIQKQTPSGLKQVHDIGREFINTIRVIDNSPFPSHKKINISSKIDKETINPGDIIQVSSNVLMDGLEADAKFNRTMIQSSSDFLIAGNSIQVKENVPSGFYSLKNEVRNSNGVYEIINFYVDNTPKTAPDYVINAKLLNPVPVKPDFLGKTYRKIDADLEFLGKKLNYDKIGYRVVTENEGKITVDDKGVVEISSEAKAGVYKIEVFDRKFPDIKNSVNLEVLDKGIQGKYIDFKFTNGTGKADIPLQHETDNYLDFTVQVKENNVPLNLNIDMEILPRDSGVVIDKLNKRLMISSNALQGDHKLIITLNSDKGIKREVPFSLRDKSASFNKKAIFILFPDEVEIPVKGKARIPGDYYIKLSGNKVAKEPISYGIKPSVKGVSIDEYGVLSVDSTADEVNFNLVFVLKSDESVKGIKPVKLKKVNLNEKRPAKIEVFDSRTKRELSNLFIEKEIHNIAEIEVKAYDESGTEIKGTEIVPQILVSDKINAYQIIKTPYLNRYQIIVNNPFSSFRSTVRFKSKYGDDIYKDIDINFNRSTDISASLSSSRSKIKTNGIVSFKLNVTNLNKQSEKISLVAINMDENGILKQSKIETLDVSKNSSNEIVLQMKVLGDKTKNKIIAFGVRGDSLYMSNGLLTPPYILDDKSFREYVYGRISTFDSSEIVDKSDFRIRSWISEKGNLKGIKVEGDVPTINENAYVFVNVLNDKDESIYYDLTHIKDKHINLKIPVNKGYVGKDLVLKLSGGAFYRTLLTYDKKILLNEDMEISKEMQKLFEKYKRYTDKSGEILFEFNYKNKKLTMIGKDLSTKDARFVFKDEKRWQSYLYTILKELKMDEVSVFDKNKNRIELFSFKIKNLKSETELIEILNAKFEKFENKKVTYSYNSDDKYRFKVEMKVSGKLSSTNNDEFVKFLNKVAEYIFLNYRQDVLFNITNGDGKIYNSFEYYAKNYRLNDELGTYEQLQKEPERPFSLKAFSGKIYEISLKHFTGKNGILIDKLPDVKEKAIMFVSDSDSDNLNLKIKAMENFKKVILIKKGDLIIELPDDDNILKTDIELEIEEEKNNANDKISYNNYFVSLKGGNVDLTSKARLILKYNPKKLKEIKSVDYIHITKDMLINNTKFDSAYNAFVSMYDGPGRYSVMEKIVNFIDIEGHWASKHIEYMSSKNVFTGYEDGSFKPNESLTRAEFITMLTKYKFTDEFDTNLNLFPKEWYGKYVSKMQELGVLPSHMKADFNLPIKREEVFYMLGSFIPSDKRPKFAAEMPFVDRYDISNYAINNLSNLAELGIVQGFEGKVNPKGNLTRAEMATILSKFDKKFK